MGREMDRGIKTQNKGQWRTQRSQRGSGTNILKNEIHVHKAMMLLLLYRKCMSIIYSSSSSTFWFLTIKNEGIYTHTLTSMTFEGDE